jgi:WD40 repeat protein
MERQSIEARAGVLTAFSRALARESHELSTHPELLWQQLYNHLQWDGDVVQQALQPEFNRRSADADHPWLWLKTPHHESSTIIRTLECKSDVRKCLFSPDGQHIFAGLNRNIQIWESKSGKLIRTIEAYSPAISPDGNWFAAKGKEQNICTWSLETGLQQLTLEGDLEAVNETAISKSGAYIAAACSDYKVRVWTADTGKLWKILDHNYNRVTSCAFSPTRSLIVTGCENGRLQLWDYQNGQKITSWSAHGTPGGVSDCSFSPNGRQILSAGSDETVRVWDAETRQEIHKFDDHRDRVYGCTFSPDGAHIASACDDKKVRVYTPSSSRFPKEFVGHTHFVVSCAFSPDGRYLISGSYDKTIRFWELSSSRSTPAGEHHDARARSCTYSPDGKTIASSGDDRSVRLWNADTGASIKTIKNHAELEVEDCAFSPDGKQIVSAGWDSTLKITNIASGETIHTLSGHEGSGYAIDGRLILGAVHTCDFSPLGDRIVSGGRDKTIRIWDVRTGSQLHALEGHNGSVQDCEYSPDARLIASVGGDNLILWEAQSGQLVHEIKAVSLSGSFNACAFSPDGASVLASKGNFVGLWDATSGETIQVYRGHSDLAYSCDVSPDGSWAASASADGEVILWELNSARITARILLPGLLHDIAFHPFEPKLVCCGAGGAVYRLEIAGISYGPIVVAPGRQKSALHLRCPACQQEINLENESAGSTITCPNQVCSILLKVNPLLNISGDDHKRWKIWKR